MIFVLKIKHIFLMAIEKKFITSFTNLIDGDEVVFQTLKIKHILQLNSPTFKTPTLVIALPLLSPKITIGPSFSTKSVKR